jgi:hypothetical protein
MKTPDAFSHEQVRDIARAVRESVRPACPVCHVPLDETAVPPRMDVSYVRDRVWLVCPSCRRSAVVDRR